MRRSSRTTSGGGSSHPSRHHGHSSRRGGRDPQRASGPFSSYDEGRNMERGMVLYDSSDEDREMESGMMHRRSGRQEDLYRQSLHDGFDSDEDVELARRSGGNGYGSYRAGNGRLDHLHSGSARRPLGRHAPSYNTIEEERPRMAGQPVLGSRSNHGPRDGGRGVRTTNLPGFPLYQERDAEWWAEENRSDRQSGQTTLGYWREGDDPQGEPTFVPNPTVDSSRIESYRNFNARR